MPMRKSFAHPASLVFALALPLVGQGPAVPPDGDELSAVLRKLGEEVRVFDQHDGDAAVRDAAQERRQDLLILS